MTLLAHVLRLKISELFRHEIAENEFQKKIQDLVAGNYQNYHLNRVSVVRKNFEGLLKKKIAKRKFCEFRG